MQTISQLNSKMWYRILKVFYILIILLIVALGIYFSFKLNKLEKTLNSDETQIICLDGNKKTLRAKEFHNLLFLDYDFDGRELTLPTEFIDTIFNKCEINKYFSKLEVMKIMKKIENDGSPITLRIIREHLQGLYYREYKIEGLAVGEKGYLITDEYEQDLLSNYQNVDKEYENPFKIVPTYDKKGGITYQILWSIITTLIIFLLSEVIKGIFYYILLGKFFPKKYT